MAIMATMVRMAGHSKMTAMKDILEITSHLRVDRHLVWSAIGLQPVRSREERMLRIPCLPVCGKISESETCRAQWAMDGLERRRRTQIALLFINGVVKRPTADMRRSRPYPGRYHLLLLIATRIARMEKAATAFVTQLARARYDINRVTNGATLRRFRHLLALRPLRAVLQ